MSGTQHVRSVLFVCLGNICRSPAAEGVFQNLVERRDLTERFKIDSAGTAGYHHGDLADPRMRKAAENRGIELHSRARKLTASDLNEFDLVVAMDRDNMRDIEKLNSSPEATVKLLSDFLVDQEWPQDVPDPYYGGESGFETVLDMLEEACPRIIDEMLGE